MGWMQTLRDRREDRREAAELENIIEDEFGVPNMSTLRRWSRKKLHRTLAERRLNAEDRLAAVGLSIVAILISLASLFSDIF
jgi:hypothetical protein